MKLFFLNHDSLYKIFTTLEKLPKNSHVQIFIESKNQFFNNPRRSKHLDNVIRKRNITARFIAQTESQRRFFEENDINHEVRKESNIRRMINLLYWFFFNIKEFHLHIYEYKNYSSLMIFGLEATLLMVIAYSVYALILPETTITITPSYQLDEVVYNFRYLYADDLKTYPDKDKHITILLHTGVLPNMQTHLTIDRLTQNDGSVIKGTIRLINTTSTPYSLVPNTQIVDDLGIEYTTRSRVDIPASQGNGQAGSVEVSIISKDTPENIALITTHEAELGAGRSFIIKNLRASKYTKQIYGELISDFGTQSQQQPGFILLNEIGQLQQALYQNLSQKMKELVNNATLPPDQIPLPYTELMSLEDCHYDAKGDSNDINQLKMMIGNLSCNLIYSYITRDDIIKGVEQYIAKRSTESQEIVSIQNNFINFFNLLTGDYNAYIIPTQVNIIESYNLSKDTNDIVTSIKNQVAGLSKDDARVILETFDEIEKGDISISPFWYSNITNIKSRIKIIPKPQQIIK